MFYLLLLSGTTSLKDAILFFPGGVREQQRARRNGLRNSGVKAPLGESCLSVGTLPIGPWLFPPALQVADRVQPLFCNQEEPLDDHSLPPGFGLAPCMLSRAVRKSLDRPGL